MEPSHPRLTVAPGQDVPTCDGRRASRYHRLNCNHIVTTSKPTPCGRNCMAISPHATARPFFCVVCHADIYAFYPRLKYYQHAMTLVRYPSLPQFEQWFDEGLAVERGVLALLASPRIFGTHRAGTPVLPEGRVSEEDLREPFHLAWVDWALPRMDVPTIREAEEQVQMVPVDHALWNAADKQMQRMILRMAYNQCVYREDGFVWLRRIKVGAVGRERRVQSGVAYTSEVPDPIPTDPEAITAEEVQALAAIEADLERDGVVSRATKITLQL